MYDSWVVYRRTPSRRNLSRFHGRAQKSWDQTDEYDSQDLRCVKQTSEKTKVHRPTEYKSNFFINAIPTLWNLRTDLTRRLKDKSDVPAEMRGDLPRLSISSKKRKTAFCSPTDEWILPATSTIKLEEREFVVDSGASMHMVSRKDLNSVEMEIVRVSKSPTTVVTASGEVPTREEAPVCVKQVDLVVKVMLLEETPAVLPWETLWGSWVYIQWISGQKPHLIRNSKRIDCNISNYVPFVVPGNSRWRGANKKKRQKCMSESWIYSWQQCFLKVHRQFSHLENSTNEDHGYNCHWTSGQKPQLIKNGRKIDCNTANYVPFVVTVLSTSSSSSIFTYFSNIFIAGNRNSHGASSINKKWEFDWGSTRKLVAWTSRNRKAK